MKKLNKILSVFLSLLIVMSMFSMFNITAVAEGGRPTGNFLTFSSSASFTIKASKLWNGTLEYSTNGENWATYAGGTNLTSARIGSSGDYYLCFRGTGNTQISAVGLVSGSYSPWVINGTAVTCSGSIETLLNYTKVGAGESTTMANYCFAYMFYNCTALISAPTLSATSTSSYCYFHMFHGCSSLREAPELPAENMNLYCYSNMFAYCTSLAVAPVLPATTLADYCYAYMFQGCTSLGIAPELPADNLASGCYTAMFGSCTTLRKAPELSATILVNSCYNSMFSGCISLAEAPLLPAITLADFCYSSMFSGCTLLRVMPALPATTLADYCYCDMFSGCTALKLYTSADGAGSSPVAWGFPTQANADDRAEWNTNMFFGTGGSFTGNPEIGETYYYPEPDNLCITFSSSTSFTVNATKWWDGTLEYSTDCKTWTVYAGGTALTAAQSGNSGLYYLSFRGIRNTHISGVDYYTDAYSPWVISGTYVACNGNIETLLDFAAVGRGEHPVMGDFCFFELFYECTALTEAPELPATTLTSGCYDAMFYGCTSLRIAPKLPATTLAYSCYGSMFTGCTSLCKAPELPATNLAIECYSYMFLYCQSLRIAPELPATNLEERCYRAMFRLCTSLIEAPELPATTMKRECYAGMFDGCSSMSELPVLPATTLADNCYYGMFNTCTGVSVYTSADEAGEYPVAWGIPAGANAENVNDWNKTMLKYAGGNLTGDPVIGETYYIATQGKSYLTFSSATSFTINATKKWNGTIEYSTDSNKWTVYEGGTALTAAQSGGSGLYYLYFRGMGNTRISNTSSVLNCSPWVINGTDVACSGNIENLLDYGTVKTGGHPEMAEFCFYKLFSGCTSLIVAPELRATTLAPYCYGKMFEGCTSLYQAPELPSTTLDDYCYSFMFYGCTSLRKAPTLPATNMKDCCYHYMFYGCSSLREAPALPATTLEFGGYNHMFYGCSSLRKAPELPATTLCHAAYESMFTGCSSLREAPELPAKELDYACYKYMFYGCTSLIEAPELPATSLDESCYAYMFSQCTSLVKAPELPATTLKARCYDNMFCACSSLTEPPTLPATTLAAYCYNYMFFLCNGILLYTNASQAGSSYKAWGIPAGADAGGAADWNTNMIFCAVGSFMGSPAPGATFYYSVPLHCVDVASKASTVNLSNKTVFTDVKSSTDISNIVTPLPGYTVTVTPSLVGTHASYNGTGTVITVKSGSTTVETYTLVVMGDVNGDSFCDARDCMLVELAVNNKTTLTDFYFKSADFDNSVTVDTTDFHRTMECAVTK